MRRERWHQSDLCIGFVVLVGSRKLEDSIRDGWISYQGGDDDAALVGDAAAVAEDPVPAPEDRRQRRAAARILHRPNYKLNCSSPLLLGLGPRPPAVGVAEAVCLEGGPLSTMFAWTSPHST